LDAGYPAADAKDLGPGIPPSAFGKGKGGVDKEDREDDAEEPSDGREVDNSRLYDLLGVDKDASSTDIKKAYHKMAKMHHPDKGGDPDAFKELQRAFEVLSDSERRQTYVRAWRDDPNSSLNYMVRALVLAF
ncbi:DNAJ1, partial [Symbiodinium sp. CCMP2456]